MLDNLQIGDALGQLGAYGSPEKVNEKLVDGEWITLVHQRPLGFFILRQYEGGGEIRVSGAFSEEQALQSYGTLEP